MTHYLLDTHSLLWWWTEHDRLGPAAREAIESRANRIIVSAASIWEIAIKSAAGKLDMIEDFRRDYPVLMAGNGFDLLNVRDAHAIEAAYLSGKHRDPFDRLLAAQALTEDLAVITRDPELAAFGCRTIW